MSNVKTSEGDRTTRHNSASKESATKLPLTRRADDEPPPSPAPKVVTLKLRMKMRVNANAPPVSNTDIEQLLDKLDPRKIIEFVENSGGSFEHQDVHFRALARHATTESESSQSVSAPKTGGGFRQAFANVAYKLRTMGGYRPMPPEGENEEKGRKVHRLNLKATTKAIQRQSHKLGEWYWLPNNAHVIVPAICVFAGSTQDPYAQFQLQWPKQVPTLLRWNSANRVLVSFDLKQAFKQSPWAFAELDEYCASDHLLTYTRIPEDLPSLHLSDSVDAAPILHLLRTKASKMDLRETPLYIQVNPQVVLSLRAAVPHLTDDRATIQMEPWIDSNPWCLTSSLHTMPSHVFKLIGEALAEVIDVECSRGIVILGSNDSSCWDYLRHGTKFAVKLLDKVGALPDKCQKAQTVSTSVAVERRGSAVKSMLLRRRSSLLGPAPIQIAKSVNHRTMSGLKRRYSITPDTGLPYRASVPSLINSTGEPFPNIKIIPDQTSSLLRNEALKDSAVVPKLAPRVFDRRTSQMFKPNRLHLQHPVTRAGSIRLNSAFRRASLPAANRGRTSLKAFKYPAIAWRADTLETSVPSTLSYRVSQALHVLEAISCVPGPARQSESTSVRVVKLAVDRQSGSLIAAKLTCWLIDTSCLTSENEAGRLRHQEAIDSKAMFRNSTARGRRGSQQFSELSFSSSESSAERDATDQHLKAFQPWPFHIFHQLLEGHHSFLPVELIKSLRFAKPLPSLFGLFNNFEAQLAGYRQALRQKSSASAVTEEGSNVSGPQRESSRTRVALRKGRSRRLAFNISGDCGSRKITSRSPSLPKQEEGEKESEYVKEDPPADTFFRSLLVDQALNGDRVFTALKDTFGFSQLELFSVYQLMATIMHLSSLHFCRFPRLDRYFVLQSKQQTLARRVTRRFGSLLASNTGTAPGLSGELSIREPSANRLHPDAHKRRPDFPGRCPSRSNLGAPSKENSPDARHHTPADTLHQSAKHSDSCQIFKPDDLRTGPGMETYLTSTEPCPLSPNSVTSTLAAADLLALPLTAFLALFSPKLIYTLNDSDAADHVFELQDHAQVYDIPSYGCESVQHPKLVRLATGSSHEHAETVPHRLSPAWIGTCPWMNYSQCCTAKLQLITALYRLVCKWIVKRLNATLFSANVTSGRNHASPLGLFDSENENGLLLIDFPDFQSYYSTTTDSFDVFTGHLTDHRLRRLFFEQCTRCPYESPKPSTEACDVSVAELPNLCKMLLSTLKTPCVPRMLSEHEDKMALFLKADSEGSDLSSSSCTSGSETTFEPFGVSLIRLTNNRSIIPSRKFGPEGFAIAHDFGVTEYHTVDWSSRCNRHLSAVFKIWERETANSILKEILHDYAPLAGTKSGYTTHKNPIAQLYDGLDKVLDEMESKKLRHLLKMTTDLLPDDSVDSREVFRQLCLFRLPTLARTGTREDHVYMSMNGFLRKFRVLVKTDRALRLGSDASSSGTSESASWRLQASLTGLVENGRLTLDEVKLIQDRDRVVQLPSGTLEKLDHLWYDVISRRITTVQSLYRGRHDRAAVMAYRVALRAHQDLIIGYERAVKNRLNYLEPPAFDKITTGEQLVAHLERAFHTMEASVIFVGKHAHEDVQRLVRTTHEHAALLCEIERMLRRQEHKLQPILALLDTVHQEGLQSDVADMLTLRAQTLKAEEATRRKILAAIKHDDLEGARQLIEDLRPDFIISPQLRRLEADFRQHVHNQADSPNRPYRSSRGHGRRYPRQRQKWHAMSNICEEDYIPFKQGLMTSNGSFRPIERKTTRATDDENLSIWASISNSGPRACSNRSDHLRGDGNERHKEMNKILV